METLVSAYSFLTLAFLSWRTPPSVKAVNLATLKGTLLGLLSKSYALFLRASFRSSIYLRGKKNYIVSSGVIKYDPI